MKFSVTALLLLTALSTTAFSEIEKVAILCKTGICLYWWPKLPAISGWHHDQDASLYYGVNALAPDHFTFYNAEAVIYAKADYKPRIPETKNVDQLIASDEKQFTADNPNLTISEVSPLSTADKKKLRSVTFFPQGKGNWERVSYGEEGDYFLVFTLSSTSRAGYDKALSAYEQLVGEYKENP